METVADLQSLARAPHLARRNGLALDQQLVQSSRSRQTVARRSPARWRVRAGGAWRLPWSDIAGTAWARCRPSAGTDAENGTRRDGRSRRPPRDQAALPVRLEIADRPLDAGIVAGLPREGLGRVCPRSHAPSLLPALAARHPFSCGSRTARDQALFCVACWSNRRRISAARGPAALAPGERHEVPLSRRHH